MSLSLPLPTHQILYFFFKYCIFNNFFCFENYLYPLWWRHAGSGPRKVESSDLCLSVSWEISLPDLTSPLSLTPGSYFRALIRHCCVTNYPKVRSLKQQTFVTHIVSEGQNSGIILVGESESRALLRLQPSCHMWLQSSQGSARAENWFPNSHAWLLASLNSSLPVVQAGHLYHRLLHRVVNSVATWWAVGGNEGGRHPKHPLEPSFIVSGNANGIVILGEFVCFF